MLYNINTISLVYSVMSSFYAFGRFKMKFWVKLTS